MAFQKGESGNPQGKPKGTRHRVTMAAEILLEGEAEAITRKAIELAKAGDGPALRLCMDRIYPARKDRPVRFGLPPLEKVGDAVAANAAHPAPLSCADSRFNAAPPAPLPVPPAPIQRELANLLDVQEAAGVQERL